MANIPNAAKWFVATVALTALSVSAFALNRELPSENTAFIALLCMAMMAARMKLSLPGIESSMSMNLPFMLIAITELTLPQALAVGAISTFIQCLPDGKQLKPLQMLFNICNMVNAIAIACVAASQAAFAASPGMKPMLIIVSALGFFVADTVPVAMVISLAERVRFLDIWQRIVVLTFPYFVLSAGVATIVVTASRYLGWQAPAVLLPVMYGVYCSFKHYFRSSAEMLKRESRMASAAAHD